jgi:hypothetical protein
MWPYLGLIYEISISYCGPTFPSRHIYAIIKEKLFTRLAGS